MVNEGEDIFKDDEPAKEPNGTLNAGQGQPISNAGQGAPQGSTTTPVMGATAGTNPSPSIYDDEPLPGAASPNVGGTTLEANSSEEDVALGATVTVGKTVYATSIFWQPLQDPDNPLPEIRETATNVMDNADLYVVRPSGMPQYGLGISSEGHRKGMPVAALSLIEAFSDIPSFVSVLKVPEGWWFLAVRNDLILAEEDMLYQKEEDAKKSFMSMMAVPDWGRKVAPAEWAIEGTEELQITELFANTAKVNLQKIKNEFDAKTIVYVAAIAIALIWGAFTLLSDFFGGEEAIREVIVPKPIVRPVAEKPKPAPPAPKPWDNLVVVSDFTNTCTEAINNLITLRIPGWLLGEISCQAKGLSTSWKKEWGRIAIFKMALKAGNVKNLHYVIADDGTSATATITFNDMKKAPSAPNLKDKEITAELVDIFQAINVPIAMNVTNVQAELPVVKKPKNNKRTGARNKKQEPVKPIQRPTLFSFVSFVFASDLPPVEWESVFNAFSSLEITAITYNPDTNTWKYEGRIYGKK